MKQLFTFCMIAVLLSACEQPAPAKHEKRLMHAVYLDLKDPLPDGFTETKLLEQLKRLHDVGSTQEVWVGTRTEEAEDARLNADYDLVLLVSFKNVEDLKAYAKDPLHMDVRSNIKKALAVKPVVYDWWTTP